VILRRLAENLRQQNWTAIGIEFVVLVAGVFLGTQVGNWNQQRELHAKAETFSARLREDLRREHWTEQVLIEYSRQVRRNAERTLAALSGRQPLGDEQFLINAYRATQYFYANQHRATFDELVSTGSMDLIADTGLRGTANATFTNPLYDTIRDRGINSEYRRLFRETVSFEAQNALTARCGDRPPRTLDHAALARVLDYPCTLGLPEASVRDAATALRAHPRLIPALQLRYADLGTASSDLTLDVARKARMQ
jgi:hypothetical protein